MKWQEYISTNPEILAGKPVISGTRISVELVLDMLGRGWTQQQILEQYDHLTPEAIQACLASAAETLRQGKFHLVSA